MSNAMIDDGHLRQMGSALPVYCVLIRRADRHDECFPSLSSIQRDTGLSRQGVLNALEKLDSLGFVKRTKKGGRKNGSNRYRVYDASEREPSVNHVDQLVNDVDQLVNRVDQRLVNHVDRKNTHIEENPNKNTHTERVCEIDPSVNRTAKVQPPAPGSGEKVYDWNQVRAWLLKRGINDARIDRAFFDHPGAEGWAHFNALAHVIQRDEKLAPENRTIDSHKRFILAMLKRDAVIDTSPPRKKAAADDGWPKPPPFVLTDELKRLLLPAGLPEEICRKIIAGEALDPEESKLAEEIEKREADGW